MIKLYRLSKTTWYVIPNTKGIYHISNYGEIRKIKYPILDVARLNKWGIHELTQKIQPFIKEYNYNGMLFEVPCVLIEENVRPINTLIYESILGVKHIDYLQILHLDGDDFNLNLENLIISDEEDNIKYKIDRKLNIPKRLLPTLDSQTGVKSYVHSIFRSYCITEYDLKGFRTNIFDGVVRLCQKNGVSRSEVLKWLENADVFARDKFYLHGYGPWKIDISLIVGRTRIQSNNSSVNSNKIILQTDNKYRLCNAFNHTLEAAYNQLSQPEEINQAIWQNKLFNGYYWFREKTSKNRY